MSLGVGGRFGLDRPPHTGACACARPRIWSRATPRAERGSIDPAAFSAGGASMPRPKGRDIGASLPPGFGGQQSLAMWFGPPGSASSQGGWMPSGMMPMPPGMMFAGGGGARHPVMEGDGRSRSRRRRRPRAHSSSRSRRRRSPSESGSGAMSDESIICGSTKKPRKTARPASSDDDIPNSYRFLGGKHIFGEKPCSRKPRRSRL